MFLRNYWYVAGYDHEIGRRPFRRVIMGEPIVFYRLEDGTPVALQDRCAHRHLPPPWESSSATRCSATITDCVMTAPALACACRGRTPFRARRG